MPDPGKSPLPLFGSSYQLSFSRQTTTRITISGTTSSWPTHPMHTLPVPTSSHCTPYSRPPLQHHSRIKDELTCRNHHLQRAVAQLLHLPLKPGQTFTERVKKWADAHGIPAPAGQRHQWWRGELLGDLVRGGLADQVVGREGRVLEWRRGLGMADEEWRDAQMWFSLMESSRRDGGLGLGEPSLEDGLFSRGIATRSSHIVGTGSATQGQNQVQAVSGASHLDTAKSGRSSAAGLTAASISQTHSSGGTSTAHSAQTAPPPHPARAAASSSRSATKTRQATTNSTPTTFQASAPQPNDIAATRPGAPNTATYENLESEILSGALHPGETWNSRIAAYRERHNLPVTTPLPTMPLKSALKKKASMPGSKVSFSEEVLDDGLGYKNYRRLKVGGGK